MPTGSSLCCFSLVLAFTVTGSSPANAEPSASAHAHGAASIAERLIDVDGLTPHYLTAGQGPAVILLHGYAETSRMWRPLMPGWPASSWSSRRTCRGLATPASRATAGHEDAAIRIHALVR